MSLKWERCSRGNYPKDAVCGGWDAINGEPLFVGRALHNGSLMIGKVHHSHGCCYVAYGGNEHKKEEYEVLVNSGNRVHLEWTHYEEGDIPGNAIEAGHDGPHREPLFIGRHSHYGDTIPGKIHRSHQCLYIPYGGKEIIKREYDVLIKVD